MTRPASTTDFKIADASSYDPLVEGFDNFVSRFCAPFADRMVALSDPDRAQQILDVGTGTGMVALRAAECAGPRGQVTGVDLSDGMLRVARLKAERAGLPHVAFHKMDAERLELADRSYDAVLSLFALTHFPDPLTALREMHRVLRPGGRLVIGVGGGPRLFSPAGLVACVRRAERELLERRGKQLTAPHFLDALTKTYLGDSQASEETAWASRRLARAAIVRRMVRDAGFRNLSCDWLEQRVFIRSAEEFWNIQATWSSIARKRLRDAPPEHIAALREEFDRICHQVLARNGRLVYPLAAFYVSARKPER